MLFPDFRAGRRRAQTLRRLPDLTAVSSISRPLVVKALVGLGLATSVAAAVAIPVRAAPEQVELSSRTSALVARDRAEAVSGTTSRGASRTGRAAVSGAPSALTAPAAAESAAVAAGPAGVTAVAKPKPTPKPKPKPKPTPKPKPKPEPAPTRTAEKESTESTDSSESSERSSESSASSSGSGVSMAYYDQGRAKGLGDNAAKVYSAVRSNFGITTIGGYRAGGGDHGAGKAVDVMVTGSRGDAVAQWAINNMDAYNITYVIWKQRIWLAGSSGWRAMEDRGSVTANHYDHVHISVE